jgi:UrcA family protein
MAYSSIKRLLAGALLLAPAIAAQAREPWLVGYQTGPAGERQARISINDLDLATPVGADALRHRVSRAADRLCVGELGLDYTGFYAACARATFDDAKPQIAALLARAASGERISMLTIGSAGRSSR